MQTRWNIWEFGLFTFNKSILWWELHINKYLPKRQEAQILRPVTLKLTTENYCTKMKKMRGDAGKTDIPEWKTVRDVLCWAST